MHLPEHSETTNKSEGDTEMNEKEQIQLAFTLWQQLAKLEELLRDRYYKEFMQLILEQEQGTILSKNTQEFVF